MKAVFFENSQIQLKDLPEPVPGPGEVLIRTSLAGICRTDLELLAGYYSFSGVPGHEFVGRVAAAPDRPELVGRRVVAEINIPCGVCAECLAGRRNHCLKRKVIGIRDHPGALAEYLTAPVANLHLVDAGLDDQEAVFTEPLAAALQVSQQVHLKAQDKVLVLGDGKLGLLLALALRVYCPRLLLAGRHPDKLALAEAQGVETIRLAAGDLVGLPEKLGRFDVVIEATGRPEGADLALGLVLPRGRLVVKTTSREPSRLDLARLVVDEISLVGSRCGDFGLALDFLKNRRLDVRTLIEAVFPLDRFAEALALARRPGARKVLVRVG